MYGNAMKAGFGPDLIQSFNALVTAIKRRQMLRPKDRLALSLGGERFSVALVGDTHVEVDGKVQPIAVERLFADALAKVGGTLDDEGARS